MSVSKKDIKDISELIRKKLELYMNVERRETRFDPRGKYTTTPKMHKYDFLYKVLDSSVLDSKSRSPRQDKEGQARPKSSKQSPDRSKSAKRVADRPKSSLVRSSHSPRRDRRQNRRVISPGGEKRRKLEERSKSGSRKKDVPADRAGKSYPRPDTTMDESSVVSESVQTNASSSVHSRVSSNGIKPRLDDSPSRVVLHREKDRLSTYATKIFSEVPVDEIQLIHRYRPYYEDNGEPKYQGYSRHVGSILKSKNFVQFYNNEALQHSYEKENTDSREKLPPTKRSSKPVPRAIRGRQGTRGHDDVIRTAKSSRHTVFSSLIDTAGSGTRLVKTTSKEFATSSIESLTPTFTSSFHNIDTSNFPPSHDPYRPSEPDRPPSPGERFRHGRSVSIASIKSTVTVNFNENKLEEKDRSLSFPIIKQSLENQATDEHASNKEMKSKQAKEYTEYYEDPNTKVKFDREKSNVEITKHETIEKDQQLYNIKQIVVVSVDDKKAKEEKSSIIERQESLEHVEKDSSEASVESESVDQNEASDRTLSPISDNELSEIREDDPKKDISEETRTETETEKQMKEDKSVTIGDVEIINAKRHGCLKPLRHTPSPESTKERKRKKKSVKQISHLGEEKDQKDPDKKDENILTVVVEDEKVEERESSHENLTDIDKQEEKESTRVDKKPEKEQVKSEQLENAKDEYEDDFEDEATSTGDVTPRPDSKLNDNKDTSTINPQLSVAPITENFIKQEEDTITEATPTSNNTDQVKHSVDNLSRDTNVSESTFANEASIKLKDGQLSGSATEKIESHPYPKSDGAPIDKIAENIKTTEFKIDCDHDVPRKETFESKCEEKVETLQIDNEYQEQHSKDIADKALEENLNDPDPFNTSEDKEKQLQNTKNELLIKGAKQEIKQSDVAGKGLHITNSSINTLIISGAEFDKHAIKSTKKSKYIDDDVIESKAEKEDLRSEVNTFNADFICNSNTEERTTYSLQTQTISSQATQTSNSVQIQTISDMQTQTIHSASTQTVKTTESQTEKQRKMSISSVDSFLVAEYAQQNACEIEMVDIATSPIPETLFIIAAKESLPLESTDSSSLPQIEKNVKAFFEGDLTDMDVKKESEENVTSDMQTVLDERQLDVDEASRTSNEVGLVVLSGNESDLTKVTRSQADVEQAKPSTDTFSKEQIDTFVREEELDKGAENDKDSIEEESGSTKIETPAQDSDKDVKPNDKSISSKHENEKDDTSEKREEENIIIHEQDDTKDQSLGGDKIFIMTMVSDGNQEDSTTGDIEKENAQKITQETVQDIKTKVEIISKYTETAKESIEPDIMELQREEKTITLQPDDTKYPGLNDTIPTTQLKSDEKVLDKQSIEEENKGDNDDTSTKKTVEDIKPSDDIVSTCTETEKDSKDIDTNRTESDEQAITQKPADTKDVSVKDKTLDKQGETIVKTKELVNDDNEAMRNEKIFQDTDEENRQSDNEILDHQKGVIESKETEIVNTTKDVQIITQFSEDINNESSTYKISTTQVESGEIVTEKNLSTQEDDKERSETITNYTVEEVQPSDEIISTHSEKKTENKSIDTTDKQQNENASTLEQAETKGISFDDKVLITKEESDEKVSELMKDKNKKEGSETIIQDIYVKDVKGNDGIISTHSEKETENKSIETTDKQRTANAITLEQDNTKGITLDDKVLIEKEESDEKVSELMSDEIEKERSETITNDTFEEVQPSDEIISTHSEKKTENKSIDTTHEQQNEDVINLEQSDTKGITLDDKVLKTKEESDGNVPELMRDENDKDSSETRTQDIVTDVRANDDIISALPEKEIGGTTIDTIDNQRIENASTQEQDDTRGISLDDKVLITKEESDGNIPEVMKDENKKESSETITQEIVKGVKADDEIISTLTEKETRNKSIDTTDNQQNDNAITMEQEDTTGISLDDQVLITKEESDGNVPELMKDENKMERSETITNDNIEEVQQSDGIISTHSEKETGDTSIDTTDPQRNENTITLEQGDTKCITLDDKVLITEDGFDGNVPELMRDENELEGSETIIQDIDVKEVKGNDGIISTHSEKKTENKSIETTDKQRTANAITLEQDNTKGITLDDNVLIRKEESNKKVPELMTDEIEKERSETITNDTFEEVQPSDEIISTHSEKKTESKSIDTTDDQQNEDAITLEQGDTKCTTLDDKVLITKEESDGNVPELMRDENDKDSSETRTQDIVTDVKENDEIISTLTEKESGDTSIHTTDPHRNENTITLEQDDTRSITLDDKVLITKEETDGNVPELMRDENEKDSSETVIQDIVNDIKTNDEIIPTLQEKETDNKSIETTDKQRNENAITLEQEDTRGITLDDQVLIKEELDGNVPELTKDEYEKERSETITNDTVGEVQPSDEIILTHSEKETENKSIDSTGEQRNEKGITLEQDDTKCITLDDKVLITKEESDEKVPELMKDENNKEISETITQDIVKDVKADDETISSISEKEKENKTIFATDKKQTENAITLEQEDKRGDILDDTNLITKVESDEKEQELMKHESEKGIIDTTDEQRKEKGITKDITLNDKVLIEKEESEEKVLELMTDENNKESSETITQDIVKDVKTDDETMSSISEKETEKKTIDTTDKHLNENVITLEQDDTRSITVDDKVLISKEESDGKEQGLMKDENNKDSSETSTQDKVKDVNSNDEIISTLSVKETGNTTIDTTDKQENENAIIMEQDDTRSSTEDDKNLISKEESDEKVPELMKDENKKERSETITNNTVEEVQPSNEIILTHSEKETENKSIDTTDEQRNENAITLEQDDTKGIALDDKVLIEKEESEEKVLELIKDENKKESSETLTQSPIAENQDDTEDLSLNDKTTKTESGGIKIEKGPIQDESENLGPDYTITKDTPKGFEKSGYLISAVIESQEIDTATKQTIEEIVQENEQNREENNIKKSGTIMQDTEQDIKSNDGLISLHTDKDETSKETGETVDTQKEDKAIPQQPDDVKDFRSNDKIIETRLESNQMALKEEVEVSDTGTAQSIVKETMTSGDTISTYTEIEEQCIETQIIDRQEHEKKIADRQDYLEEVTLDSKAVEKKEKTAIESRESEVIEMPNDVKDVISEDKLLSTIDKEHVIDEQKHEVSFTTVEESTTENETNVQSINDKKKADISPIADLQIENQENRMTQDSPVFMDVNNRQTERIIGSESSDRHVNPELSAEIIKNRSKELEDIVGIKQDANDMTETSCDQSPDVKDYVQNVIQRSVEEAHLQALNDENQEIDLKDRSTKDSHVSEEGSGLANKDDEGYKKDPLTQQNKESSKDEIKTYYSPAGEPLESLPAFMPSYIDEGLVTTNILDIPDLSGSKEYHDVIDNEFHQNNNLNKSKLFKETSLLTEVKNVEISKTDRNNLEMDCNFSSEKKILGYQDNIEPVSPRQDQRSKGGSINENDKDHKENFSVEAMPSINDIKDKDIASNTKTVISDRLENQDLLVEHKTDVIISQDINEILGEKVQETDLLGITENESSLVDIEIQNAESENSKEKGSKVVVHSADPTLKENGKFELKEPTDHIESQKEVQGEIKTNENESLVEAKISDIELQNASSKQGYTFEGSQQGCEADQSFDVITPNVDTEGPVEKEISVEIKNSGTIVPQTVDDITQKSASEPEKNQFSEEVESKTSSYLSSFESSSQSKTETNLDTSAFLTTDPTTESTCTSSVTEEDSSNTFGHSHVQDLSMTNNDTLQMIEDHKKAQLDDNSINKMNEPKYLKESEEADIDNVEMLRGDAKLPTDETKSADDETLTVVSQLIQSDNNSKQIHNDETEKQEDEGNKNMEKLNKEYNDNHRFDCDSDNQDTSQGISEISFSSETAKQTEDCAKLDQMTLNKESAESTDQESKDIYRSIPIISKEHETNSYKDFLTESTENSKYVEAESVLSEKEIGMQNKKEVSKDTEAENCALKDDMNIEKGICSQTDLKDESSPETLETIVEDENDFKDTESMTTLIEKRSEAQNNSDANIVSEENKCLSEVNSNIEISDVFADSFQKTSLSVESKAITEEDKCLSENKESKIHDDVYGASIQTENVDQHGMLNEKKIVVTNELAEESTDKKYELIDTPTADREMVGASTQDAVSQNKVSTVDSDGKSSPKMIEIHSELEKDRVREDQNNDSKPNEERPETLKESSDNCVLSEISNSFKLSADILVSETEAESSRSVLTEVHDSLSNDGETTEKSEIRKEKMAQKPTDQNHKKQDGMLKTNTNDMEEHKLSVKEVDSGEVGIEVSHSPETLETLSDAQKDVVEVQKSLDEKSIKNQNDLKETTCMPEFENAPDFVSDVEGDKVHVNENLNVNKDGLTEQGKSDKTVETETSHSKDFVDVNADSVNGQDVSSSKPQTHETKTENDAINYEEDKDRWNILSGGMSETQDELKTSTDKEENICSAQVVGDHKVNVADADYSTTCKTQKLTGQSEEEDLHVSDVERHIIPELSDEDKDDKPEESKSDDIKAQNVVSDDSGDKISAVNVDAQAKPQTPTSQTENDEIILEDDKEKGDILSDGKVETLDKFKESIRTEENKCLIESVSDDKDQGAHNDSSAICKSEVSENLFDITKEVDMSASEKEIITTHELADKGEDDNQTETDDAEEKESLAKEIVSLNKESEIEADIPSKPRSPETLTENDEINVKQDKEKSDEEVEGHVETQDELKGTTDKQQNECSPGVVIGDKVIDAESFAICKTETPAKLTDNIAEDELHTSEKERVKMLEFPKEDKDEKSQTNDGNDNKSFSPDAISDYKQSVVESEILSKPETHETENNQVIFAEDNEKGDNLCDEKDETQEELKDSIDKDQNEGLPKVIIDEDVIADLSATCNNETPENESAINPNILPIGETEKAITYERSHSNQKQTEKETGETEEDKSLTQDVVSDKLNVVEINVSLKSETSENLIENDKIRFTEDKHENQITGAGTAKTQNELEESTDKEQYKNTSGVICDEIHANVDSSSKSETLEKVIDDAEGDMPATEAESKLINITPVNGEHKESSEAVTYNTLIDVNVNVPFKSQTLAAVSENGKNTETKDNLSYKMVEAENELKENPDREPEAVNEDKVPNIEADSTANTETETTDKPTDNTQDNAGEKDSTIIHEFTDPSKDDSPIESTKTAANEDKFFTSEVPSDDKESLVGDVVKSKSETPENIIENDKIIFIEDRDEKNKPVIAMVKTQDEQKESTDNEQHKNTSGVVCDERDNVPNVDSSAKGETIEKITENVEGGVPVTDTESISLHELNEKETARENELLETTPVDGEHKESSKVVTENESSDADVEVPSQPQTMETVSESGETVSAKDKEMEDILRFKKFETESEFEENPVYERKVISEDKVIDVEADSPTTAETETPDQLTDNTQDDVVTVGEKDSTTTHEITDPAKDGIQIETENTAADQNKSFTSEVLTDNKVGLVEDDVNSMPETLKIISEKDSSIVIGDNQNANLLSDENSEIQNEFNGNSDNQENKCSLDTVIGNAENIEDEKENVSRLDNEINKAIKDETDEVDLSKSTSLDGASSPVNPSNEYTVTLDLTSEPKDNQIANVDDSEDKTAQQINDEIFKGKDSHENLTSKEDINVENSREQKYDNLETDDKLSKEKEMNTSNELLATSNDKDVEREPKGDLKLTHTESKDIQYNPETESNENVNPRTSDENANEGETRDPTVVSHSEEIHPDSTKHDNCDSDRKVVKECNGPSVKDENFGNNTNDNDNTDEEGVKEENFGDEIKNIKEIKNNKTASSNDITDDSTDSKTTDETKSNSLSVVDPTITQVTSESDSTPRSTSEDTSYTDTFETLSDGQTTAESRYVTSQTSGRTGSQHAKEIVATEPRRSSLSDLEELPLE